MPRMAKNLPVLILIGCVLLTGCSAWRSWRGTDRPENVSFSLGGMRISKAIKPISDIRRENVIFQAGDFSCGSAAVATIMKYYFGDDLDEQSVIDGIIQLSNVKRLEKIIKRKGLSLLDLKRFAVSRGYDAKGYLMGLDDLMELEVPAIVPVVVQGYDHFVVFRGATRDRILIADPSVGNMCMRAHNFLPIWKGNVVFVISNGKVPEQAPLMIDEEDMLFLESHFVMRAMRNAVLSY